MKKFILIIAACFFLTMPKITVAQDILKIAAVINNQIISLYDLNMRSKLLILFSGLPDLPETKIRLRPQLLKTMIDEELKLQEAERQKINITKKEIDSELRRLEKRNKQFKKGIKKYLAKNKIEISVLNKRIKTSISWVRLVNLRYGSSVIVVDEEIDENIANIQNNAGKPEYRVSEIFLPIENIEKSSKVLAIANRLIKQMNSGATFSNLAKSFSKNFTARNGGDMGWIRTGQLDSELDTVLRTLKSNQVSKPIKTIEGYYILYLKERRIALGFGQPDPESAMVNIQPLIVPIIKDASKAKVRKATSLAVQAGQNARSCKDFEIAAKKIGSPLSGNLGNLKINTLGSQQKKLIKKLPLMKASKPYRTPDGIMTLMVCRRDESKTPKISKEKQRQQIKSNIRNDQLEILSQQYIQELRRDAFVDVRL